MFTIVGAILGFVVGGGLALTAFWGGMYLGFSGASHSAQDAAVGIYVIFTLPVVLLGSIIGLPIGALVGGRIDRRRGKVSVTRRVLHVAFLAIGALVVTLALLSTIFGASVGEWLVILTGFAGIAVGAALCFGGWWVNRGQKRAERRQHE